MSNKSRGYTLTLTEWHVVMIVVCVLIAFIALFTYILSGSAMMPLVTFPLYGLAGFLIGWSTRADNKLAKLVITWWKD